jgi:hypothetical protein
MKVLVIVPLHRELAKSTLKSVLKMAKIIEKDFRKKL